MKPLGMFGLLLAALTLQVAPALAACDNPFFPARPNSSKTFAIKGKNQTYTVSVVNAGANGFTLRYEYTDPVRVLENPYTCTGEGLRASSLGAGVGAGPDANVTTTVTRSGGIVIPAADRWRVGATWTFSNEGTITANDRTQGTLVYTFKNVFTFRVVAEEQVKVPAGTFTAFKVTLTQKGEFGANGKSTPVAQTITQWFVRGVGLVRQEGGFGAHELVSYKK